jgi:hypothetical protein
MGVSAPKCGLIFDMSDRDSGSEKPSPNVSLHQQAWFWFLS